MSRIFAQSCLACLVILVAAFYLPQLYEQLFLDRVKKTHLFYSPVAREFIYREKIVGTIPEEVQQKSEEQINVVAYRTEKGRWLHRLEFERLLPFIYYKDMEVRGLLPMEIDGHFFTKEEIKAERRVIELLARDMRKPRTAVYPLFALRSDRARLVFPKDRFYWHKEGLIFVNIPANREDSALTGRAAAVLDDAGFQPPVVNAFGNFTVLKPFDAGVFLLDSKGQLFHLQRMDDQLSAAIIPLPEGVRVKYLRVAESLRSPYCAILVGEDDRLYLLSRRGYQWVSLPVTDYDSTTMDLKIIFNPLYNTAVFSDDKHIYAVAMDKKFALVARYHHQMSRSRRDTARLVCHMIFPFILTDRKEGSGFIDIHFYSNGYGLVGMAAAAFFYICLVKLRRQRIAPASFAIVFLFGIYGLLALCCIDSSSSRVGSYMDKEKVEGR